MAHDIANPANVYFCAEITKVVDNDDGTVTVRGVCSDDSLDLDGQRADPTWLRQALSEWFANWANIREMHQPSAVGTATELDWDGDEPVLTARIMDPLAVQKVRDKVYKAFSIGVKAPQLRYDQRAPKGWIVGGTIVETSIVDRPANSNTGFQLVKAVSADEVQDVQTGAVWKRVDPNVGGGVDRSKLDDSSFVFPDERDFPIVTPGDVSDAVSSWGRYKGEHSFADFKSRLAALAHRKGESFVSELPAEWTKEDKVADTTDEKTVEADAGKSVDAPIEKDAEAELKAAEADDDSKEADDELDMAAKAARAADESAYCAECRSVSKMSDVVEKVAGGHTILFGACSEGHTLTKYVGADTAKSAAADEAKDAEAEKTTEADAAKDADADTPKDAEAEKTADADTGKDAEATAEKAALSAITGDDVLKDALAELLKDAGIDLGKVGKRMAQARLSRFNDAVDQLKAIAAELTEPASGDAEKAAGMGGPSLVSNPGDGEAVRTRLVAAVRVVNELCAQLTAGDGRFGLGDERQDGVADAGKAELIHPAEWDFTKSAEADTTKSATHDQVDISAVAAELAKSVGAHMEQAISPLVRRLEEVEHTAKPASPPLLQVAERDHAFSAKAATAEDIQKSAVAQRLAEMSQADREHVLAEVLSSTRGWK